MSKLDRPHTTRDKIYAEALPAMPQDTDRGPGDTPMATVPDVTIYTTPT